MEPTMDELMERGKLILNLPAGAQLFGALLAFMDANSFLEPDKRDVMAFTVLAELGDALIA